MGEPKKNLAEVACKFRAFVPAEARLVLAGLVGLVAAFVSSGCAPHPNFTGTWCRVSGYETPLALTLKPDRTFTEQDSTGDILESGDYSVSNDFLILEITSQKSRTAVQDSNGNLKLGFEQKAASRERFWEMTWKGDGEFVLRQLGSHTELATYRKGSGVVTVVGYPSAIKAQAGTFAITAACRRGAGIDQNEVLPVETVDANLDFLTDAPGPRATKMDSLTTKTPIIVTGLLYDGRISAIIIDKCDVDVRGRVSSDISASGNFTITLDSPVIPRIYTTNSWSGSIVAQNAGLPVILNSGATITPEPDANKPFSLQLGDPVRVFGTLTGGTLSATGLVLVNSSQNQSLPDPRWAKLFIGDWYSERHAHIRLDDNGKSFLDGPTSDIIEASYMLDGNGHITFDVGGIPFLCDAFMDGQSMTLTPDGREGGPSGTYYKEGSAQSDQIRGMLFGRWFFGAFKDKSDVEQNQSIQFSHDGSCVSVNGIPCWSNEAGQKYEGNWEVDDAVLKLTFPTANGTSDSYEYTITKKDNFYSSDFAQLELQRADISVVLSSDPDWDEKFFRDKLGITPGTPNP